MNDMDREEILQWEIRDLVDKLNERYEKKGYSYLISYQSDAHEMTTSMHVSGDFAASLCTLILEHVFKDVGNADRLQIADILLSALDAPQEG